MGCGRREQHRRRGRPRIRRSIDNLQLRCYAPQCNPDKFGEEPDAVELLPEEIEALKLVDLQNLDQEEAAAVLGISRRTLWRDLHEARRKIADALVHGKGIEIAGCTTREQGFCPKQNPDFCPKETEQVSMQRSSPASRTTDA
ncbi:hypothetical protein ASZ90_011414 [hydrocarbon metagenome]|uniref:Uncharacterized protein n=1 Tax=hydrocarbon metagenome TaxID=938273 RepID=A0A0W8FDC3_9ZZZZ